MQDEWQVTKPEYGKTQDEWQVTKSEYGKNTVRIAGREAGEWQKFR